MQNHYTVEVARRHLMDVYGYWMGTNEELIARASAAGFAEAAAALQAAIEAVR